ncbi:MAG: sugar nucleotide-binding protein [Xanthomonadales bacterium]|nr:sugar nucleotide-binding protein [Xanthomonadales bacterium]
MERLLIAGCGALGNGLGALLESAPTRVFGLRRNVAALHPSIEGISADLSQAMAPLPAVDALVYTATPAERTEAAYRSAYVDGLRHVLQALPGPVQRIIYVSSTSVLADSAGEWIDENTPANPPSATAAILREGECLALEHGATVLRFAGIYGPKRLWMLRTASQQDLQCNIDPPQWTNRIHEYDCIRAIHHLLTIDQPDSLYHGVDDEPATRYAVLSWLREQLNLPAPGQSNGVDQNATATSQQAQATGKATGKRLRNDKLKATGWQPEYPNFRTGYADTLAQAG